MKHIMKCDKCLSYTMKLTCPKCSLKTSLPRPVKYSPQDKYGEYRRKAKELSREN